MVTRLAGQYRILCGQPCAKLRRSLRKLSGEARFMVNMDEEKGERVRLDKDGVPKNAHRVAIRVAKNEKIRLASLDAWLKGSTDFTETVLETISESDIPVTIAETNHS